MRKGADHEGNIESARGWYGSLQRHASSELSAGGACRPRRGDTQLPPEEGQRPGAAAPRPDERADAPGSAAACGLPSAGHAGHRGHRGRRELEPWDGAESKATPTQSAPALSEKPRSTSPRQTSTSDRGCRTCWTLQPPLKGWHSRPLSGITCFATWSLRSQDHHSCFTITTTRGAADNAIQREVCNRHQLCTRSVHDHECRRAVKSELERRQTWCNAVSAGISSILGALDGMRIARSAQRSMQACGCSSLEWQWYYYA